MYTNNDISICRSLKEFSDWKISSNPKSQNKYALISTPQGYTSGQILELERNNPTVKKCALAFLITIGTLFCGLFDERLRDLWTGKQVKKVVVYDPRLANQTAYTLMRTRETGFLAFDSDKKHKTIKIGHTECHGDSKLRKIAVQASLEAPHTYANNNLLKYASVNRPLYTTLLMKRASHAFSIQGNLETSKGSFSLEGFNETFTIPMLLHSFNQFALKNKLKANIFNWMQNCFANMVWHENVTDAKINTLYDSIQRRDKTPSIISSGYDWHSNQVIFFDRYLILCDRGGKSGNKSGISIYSIEDKSKITKEFLSSLANRLSTDSKNSITTKMYKESADYLLKNFGIKHIDTIPMKSLKAGICTYGNFKAAIFALMMIYDRITKNETIWEDSANNARPVYKKFVHFDKESVMQDFHSSKQEICSKVSKDKLDEMYYFMKGKLIQRQSKVVPLGDSQHFFRS